ncbi:MAG: hypothetical protein F6K55_35160 [Moorea sp. SIO4A3]|nr:hypothetical protein [Moorena sp. SIO4A3]
MQRGHGGFPMTALHRCSLFPDPLLPAPCSQIRCSQIRCSQIRCSLCYIGCLNKAPYYL